MPPRAQQVPDEREATLEPALLRVIQALARADAARDYAAAQRPPESPA